MVIAVTSLKKFPENCIECRFLQCQLPNKQRGEGVIRKYHSQRHRECPLKEVAGVKPKKD